MSTKVRLVKSTVFPVVRYGCESWTIKKAECRRIDAFELWCWRRLLRIPWTARRSNQSIPKEISLEYSRHTLPSSLGFLFLKMLTPWKESYEQPRQHIEKQRHYFANKVHLVKAMVFPVVMYGCESWTVKKAERQRSDAFELWCRRRFLRVP